MLLQNVNLSLSANLPQYSTQAMDSVLLNLDETIKNKQVYTDEKQKTLDVLYLKLRNSTKNEDRFIIYGELFEQLKNFQMDSALVIAHKRLELAEGMNSTEKVFYANMNIAEVMIVTGMYKEALDILDQIDKSKITEAEQKQRLYHLYHSLYILMAQYSFIYKQKEEYYTKVRAYKDSLLGVLPEDNIGYDMVLVSKLISDGKNEEAFQLANELYTREKGNFHILAMLMHDIADIYRKEDDLERLKFVLAISAINDLKSGVKEYMSLPELATILYENGDVERSYLYMKSSLEDAIFCKARFRAIQMSQTLPIINASYDAKMKKEQRQLVFVICITVFLVIVLMVSLFFIYKKLKEIALMRKTLRKTNKELLNVNDDLNKLNAELSESNKVKEEYIGYVFSICSLYIEKLDNFRKRVNRQIKGGLVNELYQQTKTNTLANEELKEFYKSFDNIFLKLYPNFVEDFNSLMSQNEKIYPKEGELLSPELRIYALVRLGISDSTKIATFLHYSTQTVYNYRLKVRNKANIDKTNFVEAVQSLGKIKE